MAAEPGTAQQRLERLKELILSARAMPMSASCVINRAEVLGAIDDVLEHLPNEVAEARSVVGAAEQRVADGRAEAERILAEARQHTTELARHSEVVRVAEQLADQLRADAEVDVRALRKETDSFVDSRMAGFESVLHKTLSQVKTARAKLAERSDLDPNEDPPAS